MACDVLRDVQLVLWKVEKNMNKDGSSTQALKPRFLLVGKLIKHKLDNMTTNKTPKNNIQSCVSNCL